MNKVFIFVLGATVGSLVTWKIVEQKYKKIADDEIESVVKHFKNKENSQDVVDEKKPHPKRSGKYPWGSKEYVENLTEEEKNDYQKTLDEYEQLAYDYSTTELEAEKIVDKVTYEEYLQHMESPIVIEPDDDYITPYTISPEEFGEYDNAEKNWTLYSDGVITDEYGDIISDYENYIGDGLQHIGEFVDNVIHVRNENLYWDIELTRIDKSFSEMNKG